MNKPAAFRATYSDLKLIKTRQCVQVIFELPLADFDAAYTILGGMPNPASETWFGIAPLKNPPAEKEPLSTTPATPQPATDKPQAGAKPEQHTVGSGLSKLRMDWRELQPAAQAGIRCADPVFRTFMFEDGHSVFLQTSEDAADAVREFCGVESRSELCTNHKARVLWHSLDEHFLAWKMKERVGV